MEIVCSSIPLPPLLQPPDVLPFEEEVLRNPYDVKTWHVYLSYLKETAKDPKAVIIPPAPFQVLQVNIVYERAIDVLPGSYKLWRNYLLVSQCVVPHTAQYRRAQLRKRPSPRVLQALNNTYERGLVFMNKYPRFWIDFLEVLIDQGLITQTRRTFDRSLKALPVTQHERIWELMLRWVEEVSLPETAIRIYRRYLKMDCDAVEIYVKYLKQAGQWGEAAEQLAGILNRPFQSREGKSTHQLWLELCEIIATHPEQVSQSDLNATAIIRSGISKYTDEVGRLWTALADFYIRQTQFEKARDVYEEAIGCVLTVKDFSQVFDAYAAFEESMIAARMEADASGQAMGGENAEAEEVDLDLRMARLEYLMDRRPLLLNSVMLRQNPHNVAEWHKRVSLFKDQPLKIIETFTEAVATVDPHRQTAGRVFTLWVAFARYYEAHEDIESARKIFRKAVQAELKSVDSVAQVWSEWAELELRHKEHDRARAVLREGTMAHQPDADYWDDSIPPRYRVFKSIKLWSFYADVEESLGTLDDCRAVYDRMIDLKVATPQTILNYAVVLEEKQYFEDSFRAYERGVQLFSWPHVRDIWLTYLSKFMERFGGKKLERARDLFEQCLEKIPAKDAKTFYLMYAKLEESYGLARHAMAIYDRATRVVPKSERASLFRIYIERIAKYFSVTRTREVYERAIESLDDVEARDVCLEYAELERNLGEIDRARAIFTHGSQFADPRTDVALWKAWNSFEVHHGNEDTFRDMLRIKRSVQAQFNLTTNLTALPVDATEPVEEEDSIQALERTVAPSGGGEGGFVKATNPDEIDLDDDDDDEEEKVDPTPALRIEQQPVPDAVFGDAMKKLQEEEEAAKKRPAQAPAPQGALARMKRARG